uniref:Uncharacterized protein n=1 Tax=Candidatus Kentrum sp. LFY TaxID=2126342 RepID=A0A450V8J9_9GAMM|nr:MAG: hypothetical protein BECKLFY1418B_GA0070995_12221 [Candidatus Kentron sp. LFY]
MQSAAASNAGTTDTESNTGTSKPDTDAQVKELVFICERLSAYHSIGRDFLERWQRITSFLVVLSGTVAFFTSLTWKL